MRGCRSSALILLPEVLPIANIDHQINEEIQDAEVRLIGLDGEQLGIVSSEEALKVAVNRHDLSVIEVYDPRERNIPDIGLVHVKDSETGKAAWINTSDRKMRLAYEEWFRNVEQSSSRLFMRFNVDKVSIALDDDYVKGLMTLFKNR